MMVEVGGASSTYLAGDFTNGLNEFQGELSDRGENLPDREARDHASLAMGDTVLALAGGSFFELLVHFVADAASLLDRLLHGEDETGNGLFGEMGQRGALKPGGSDAEPPPGLAQVGVAFARMNQNNRNLGGMAISLTDHLCSRTELFSGPGNGRGGSQSAEFEFKNRGGLVTGEGDGVEFPEAVSTPKLVSVLRILVTDDPSISQVEVVGQDGANPDLCRRTDDGEGGRLNPDLPRALPFPTASEGETLRPALIFAIVITNQIHLSVVRRGRRVVRMGIQDRDSGFLAPTTQQMPALQRTKARVPDQNHSPPAENFWWAAQARRERPIPFRRRPNMTKDSQRNIISR